MKIAFSMMAIVFSAMSAQANLLDYSAAKNIKTKSGQSVPDSAVAANSHAAGQAIDLKTLGAGMRVSYLLGPIAVQVYVGQLLTDKDQSTGQINLQNAAKPDYSQLIANNTSVALTMKFVRKVTSNQLIPAFTGGFSKNNVDMTSAPIKAFLAAMQAYNGLNSGDLVAYLLNKNPDGSVTLSIQRNSEAVVTIESRHTADASVPTDVSYDEVNFEQEILSLWLGQTTDKGVTQLQGAIVQGL